MTEYSEKTKAWLAVRKAEALKIDPETAIVDWQYGQTMDPYGVEPDLPDEMVSVGREFFVADQTATFGSASWICRAKPAARFGSRSTTVPRTGIRRPKSCGGRRDMLVKVWWCLPEGL